MNEQKLLAVLDMSEDEQDYWTVENTDRGIRGGNYESLADLAFRLRDEIRSKVNYSCWMNAKETVAKAIWSKHKWHKRGSYKYLTSIYTFWTNQAQPIHWIIAALIAKDKDDK